MERDFDSYSNMRVQRVPYKRGKRVVVSTDLVTGVTNGFEDLDHFSIKGAFQKLKAAGKKLDEKVEKKAPAVAKVAKVTTKVAPALAVAGLTLGAVKTGAVTSALSKLNPALKSKTVTPLISPLKPSVPTSPAEEGIKTALTSGGSLTEKVKALANKIPVGQIKEKAQSLITEGIKTKLTPAQKDLSEMLASPGLLPKTKELVEAEKVLTAPLAAGALSDGPGSSDVYFKGISMKNPMVIGGILLAVFIIVVVVLKK